MRALPPSPQMAPICQNQSPLIAQDDQDIQVAGARRFPQELEDAVDATETIRQSHRSDKNGLVRQRLLPGPPRDFTEVLANAGLGVQEIAGRTR